MGKPACGPPLVKATSSQSQTQMPLLILYRQSLNSESIQPTTGKTLGLLPLLAPVVLSPAANAAPVSLFLFVITIMSMPIHPADVHRLDSLIAP